MDLFENNHKNQKHAEVQHTVARLKEKFFLKKIVGHSPRFLELVRHLPVVAKSGVNVIIEGETGTGKELFARAIHYLSPRRSGPFIAVNAATLPAALFENEMFGHDSEAFTDAKSCRTGIIDEAEGGTIFLDEINSLERPAQGKLLRYLEEKRYKPLGSRKYVHSDVRIVAATNSDLMQMVREGRFAQDLFYRLSVITFLLPPLRERKEDIPLLIDHFLEKYRERFGARKISPEAMQMLSIYDWPGNIRELENFIQEMLILHTAPIIEVNDIKTRVTKIKDMEILPKFTDAKKAMIAKFEKDYISLMLRMHNGNITQAAKMAGKDRRSFGRLVLKHGLLGHTRRLKDDGGHYSFV